MTYARLGFLVVVVVVVAIATPAAAEDVIGNPLEGPFATRDAACEAVLATRGTCATYRTKAAPTATRGWDKVEVGAVADRHRANTTTRHFGLFVEVGKKWFARFLGTEGTVDTEFFPHCEPGGGNCTPFHRDVPAHYTPPKLSWVDAVKGGAKELVMFYPTPSDVGFRTFAPTGELVQVCGLGAAGVPSCTETFVAVTRSRARVKSPADLFTGDGNVVQASDVQLDDGSFQSDVGHLEF